MNGKRLRIAVINLLAEIVDVLLFFLGSRIRLDLVTVDSVSNCGLRCVKGWHVVGVEYGEVAGLEAQDDGQAQGKEILEECLHDGPPLEIWEMFDVLDFVATLF